MEAVAVLSLIDQRPKHTEVRLSVFTHFTWSHRLAAGVLAGSRSHASAHLLVLVGLPLTRVLFRLGHSAGCT